MARLLDRRCRECKNVKPRDAFSPDAGRADGLNVYCDDCIARLAEVYEGTKVCTRCEEEKPKSAFGRSRRHASGLAARCKPCARITKAESRERHPPTPEQARQYKATYESKNAETVAAYRRRRALAQHGLTVDDFNEMVRNQGGVCAICGKEETGLSVSGEVRDLSLDHCHRTGSPRGALCTRCNTAIGLLDDSRETLLAAIAYLERTAVASGL